MIPVLSVAVPAVIAVIAGVAGIVRRASDSERKHTDEKIEALEAHLVSDLGELQVRLDRADEKADEREKELHSRISGLRNEVQALEREFHRGHKDIGERVVRIETKVLNGK